MIKKSFKVISEYGIHARPATKLVALSSTFYSDALIESEGRRANIKSIMGLMSLGIYQNAIITIITDGIDEEDAINELSRYIIENNMGEEV